MEIKHLLARKTTVIGIVAVLVIVSVIVVLSEGNISGKAISFTPVKLDFPVIADTPDGWTNCEIGQEQTWAQVNEFCRRRGYGGAADPDYNPCLHEWQPTRYYWDGNMPMQMGNSVRTAGYALTQIKCVPAEA